MLQCYQTVSRDKISLIARLVQLKKKSELLRQNYLQAGEK